MNLDSALIVGNEIANAGKWANRGIVASGIAGVATGAVAIAGAFGAAPPDVLAEVTPERIQAGAGILAAVVLLAQGLIAWITNPNAGVKGPENA